MQKKKHFIAALKDNRLFALSEKDKKEGRFVRVDMLQLTDKQAVRGWLKGFGDEVLLVRQVFTNKDGSTGILNLVCSDLTLDGAGHYDLQETVVIHVGAGFAPGRGKWKSFTNR